MLQPITVTIFQLSTWLPHIYMPFVQWNLPFHLFGSLEKFGTTALVVQPFKLLRATNAPFGTCAHQTGVMSYYVSKLFERSLDRYAPLHSLYPCRVMMGQSKGDWCPTPSNSMVYKVTQGQTSQSSLGLLRQKTTAKNCCMDVDHTCS